MTDTAKRTAIEVQPTSGYTGAEIHGVDLGADLDDATIGAIRAALHQWKVLFFRDQDISHSQQIAFARRFGKVTPSHPLIDGVTEELPEILPIDSRRYAQQFGSKKKVTYDNGWHTDVTALVNPPAASILRAEIVPPYGGDTQWTNLVAAYENLPEALRQLADKLRAKHSFASIAAAPGGTFTQRVSANPLVAIHPVVRIHPETGERALFVSPSFTQADREIVGFSRRQSERILDLLWEEATRPEYTVRFRWEPGSVAFWDNRATSHLGPSDVPDGFDRVLYRVTLEGDVPVGPDGKASELVEGQPFLGN